jgi:FtsH-binding integral membrane protein
MFFGMLFSTLTGLMVIFRGKYSYLYAWITVVFIGIGGLVFGPIVQKYAFDAYWTGWPFGHDLTDNKSVVAFLFWVIALWTLKKNRDNKLWPIVAAIILLVVFMIPHSVLGSEIDYTKEQQVESGE